MQLKPFPRQRVYCQLIKSLKNLLLFYVETKSYAGLCLLTGPNGISIDAYALKMFTFEALEVARHLLNPHHAFLSLVQPADYSKINTTSTYFDAFIKAIQHHLAEYVRRNHCIPLRVLGIQQDQDYIKSAKQGSRECRVD